MHLSAAAKLQLPAHCIAIDRQGPLSLLVSDLLCSTLYVRSNRVEYFVVSMTIFRHRRPRGSTAKLSIPERISATGGTKEPEGVLHSKDAGRLDAAQKINLVKLDPPIVYCPDAAGDNFRSGDRDVPLVNCNRISESLQSRKRLRDGFVALVLAGQSDAAMRMKNECIICKLSQGV